MPQNLGLKYAVLQHKPRRKLANHWVNGFLGAVGSGRRSSSMGGSAVCDSLAWMETVEDISAAIYIAKRQTACETSGSVNLASQRNIYRQGRLNRAVPTAETSLSRRRVSISSHLE